MTDLMPMIDAYKVLMSNIAKFAEANGAELDYTNELTYEDSVYDWYKNYVQAKYESEEGEYDEYIEVINDIMFEIMGKLTIDEHGDAYVPSQAEERKIEGVGHFITVNNKLQIWFEEDILTKNQNPFIIYENNPETGKSEPKVKCPEEVEQLFEQNGYTFDVGTYYDNPTQMIETPFQAKVNEEE